MKTSITKTILLFFALLICNLGYAFDYTNAIPNGDFENGATGWNGTVVDLTIDGRSVKAGENNIYSSGRISLEPRTTYNVRCSFMEKDGVEGIADALFGIVLYDSTGNEITNSNPAADHPMGINYSSWKSVWYKYLPYFDTITSWNTISFIFSTGNNVTEGTIKLIRLNSSRTYYYDKIELFERPYADNLDNGSFEETYSWGDWKLGWSKYLGNMQIETASNSGFGDKHLRITGGTSNDTGAVSTYDKILISPNTEYSFSVLLRTDTVPVSTNTALFGIKFYDKNQSQITTVTSDFVFSTYLNMHYRYIDKINFNTQWQPWKVNFITPENARSAKFFFYKWCDDQNGDPSYIELDQLTLTKGNDQLSVCNYGFEVVYNNLINQFFSNYIVSTEAFDGHYALEVSDANRAESAYIPVEGSGYYLFRTMVMEPQNILGTNTVYFTIQAFDADKNSLGQTYTVQNMNAHYNGIHWYSYLKETPLDDAFQPDSTWKRYERWFQIPASARFMKFRLWNNKSGYATRFDNTEIRQLKYRTAGQTGTKSMVLWYGNMRDGANEVIWPPNSYITTDKVKAFYPYIAHSTNSTLDEFDEWMIESVLFMSSYPSQTPDGWNAYLDNVFSNSGTYKWLIDLNQAVVDTGNKLNDSTHKVNVIISVPLLSGGFDIDNYLSVVTAPATDKKVADWYYDNVIQRWDNIKALTPRLNLLGFYLEDENPSSLVSGFIKELSVNIKAGGYKFYAAPYTSKIEITIGGEEKERDIVGPTYFMPKYFDSHFIQPGYFYSYTYRAKSLVDYTIIWSGLNNSSIVLEWTGNNERFLCYLDKSSEYGLQNQDASYMLYETAGWLYNCAEGDVTQRSLYNKLNDLLHNNHTH